MTRAFAALAFAALLLAAASGQSTSPRESFEVADIHASPRVSSQTGLNVRSVLRGGRYEIRNATIVDMIRTAYTIDADKSVGGPNWVEFDRFDVIAKAAPGTPQDMLKLRLQGLLADRFKRILHNETKSVPGYALAMGKGKPKLKESTGNGASGCKRQNGQLAVVNGRITIGSKTNGEFMHKPPCSSVQISAANRGPDRGFLRAISNIGSLCARRNEVCNFANTLG